MMTTISHSFRLKSSTNSCPISPHLLCLELSLARSRSHWQAQRRGASWKSREWHCCGFNTNTSQSLDSPSRRVLGS